MAKVLIVDDEPKLGRLIAEMLTSDGHEAAALLSGREALAELERNSFDILLTDLRMPEVDGLTLLQAVQTKASPPVVMMMTAHGSTESAVAAMKAGAADYLLKPFSMDELRLKVRRTAEGRSAARRSARLLEQLTPNLVAESPKMRSVLAAAKQVAATDATVLLLGESGTGKSQLARFIHYESKRAEGPLVEVHCAALPESLLEGELFGHGRGAFTGAVERKSGYLAEADGGTLFLDEIGELTAATQVKLLRFLQEREYVPLGTTVPKKVNVRVIAATNRDIASAVKAGTFREDFYYRLTVFQILVASLRERPEDVLPLAHRFLASRGLPSEKLTAPAANVLRAYSWPGNVRELENHLERALILCGEGAIGAEHVAHPQTNRALSKAAEVLTEGFNLDDFERDLLHAALQRTGGNKSAAAKLLGISRRRLYSRLESLGQAEEPEA